MIGVARSAITSEDPQSYLSITGLGIHVAGERISGTKSTRELDGWDGSAVVHMHRQAYQLDSRR
jgi:hypothetical protein